MNVFWSSWKVFLIVSSSFIISHWSSTNQASRWKVSSFPCSWSWSMSSLKYTQLLSLEVLPDSSACLIHSEARSSTTRDARVHSATSSMLEDWGQDSTPSEDPPLTIKDAWAASATSSTRSTTQHSIHSEDPPPTTRDVSDPGATSSTWARRKLRQELQDCQRETLFHSQQWKQAIHS